MEYNEHNKPSPQITINRCDKPFPNGWLVILVLTTGLIMIPINTCWGPFLDTNQYMGFGIDLFCPVEGIILCYFIYRRLFVQLRHLMFA